jgi:hypothetical protein
MLITEEAEKYHSSEDITTFMALGFKGSHSRCEN